MKENEAVNNEEALEAEKVEAEDVETEVINDDDIVIEEAEAETVQEVGEEVAEDMKSLAETLVKAEAEAKQNLDRYQRTMAEFENFRKRTLKEKSQMFENGAKEVLEGLLPVVDNFERAILHITDDEKELSFTKGVDMIYKQLVETMKNIGVEEIEAKGQPFDPNLHHAVSHEDDPDYDDNIVVEVFQKGYTYKDSVLRHAMVKVVN